MKSTHLERVLKGHMDAYYANYLDKRRSKTSYALFGNVVSWKSIL